MRPARPIFQTDGAGHELRYRQIFAVASGYRFHVDSRQAWLRGGKAGNNERAERRLSDGSLHRRGKGERRATEALLRELRRLIGVRCGSCEHRAAIQHTAIKAYAGNMRALSSLRLKCSRCSSKDIETRLVYTEEEVRGFLRGVETVRRGS
jgi:hypothetical protein